MYKISDLRAEVSAGSIAGYAESIKILSGIERPANAIEVFIMYIALEAIRGNDLAANLLDPLRRWYESRRV